MVYINEHIESLDLAAALQSISPQRRQQALRYKHEQGQRQCVAAYLLLKQALKEQEGISDNPVFEYGEHGKPFIVGHPELYFSLSHCKEATACVLSRRPVGIDVESVGRYRESVARYAMSDAEMLQIHQAEHPEVMFTRLWTMKESLLKLTGEGINDQMKTVLDNVPASWFKTTEHIRSSLSATPDLAGRLAKQEILNPSKYILTVCEQ
jgi:4'-phosphopantetheinyl transferase